MIIHYDDIFEEIFFQNGIKKSMFSINDVKFPEKQL